MPLPTVSAGSTSIPRHGPSKLRMSSSDAGAASAALNLPAASAALGAGLQVIANVAAALQPPEEHAADRFALYLCPHLSVFMDDEHTHL